MKIPTTILLLLFTTVIFCEAECQSILYAKKSTPQAGVENYYVYTPDKRLLVPDSIKVVVIYLNKQNIQVNSVNVRKMGNNYTFPFTVPDSTSTIIFCISKPKPLNKFDLSIGASNIVDNNNGIGFVIPLYNKEGKRFDFETIDKATLFYRFAPHLFKLNEISKAQLINWYEKGYKNYPNLKSAFSFNHHYYLELIYKVKGDRVKPLLLNYAKQLENMKQDEVKWDWAARIYNILGMQNEQLRIEDDIVKAYPKGIKAKEIYWQKFFSSEEFNNLDTLSSALINYIKFFNDSSSRSKDNFYFKLVSLYLQKKLFDSLPRFEVLVTDKVGLSHLYNNYATLLSSEKNNSLDSNLNIAKKLSKKAINFTEFALKNFDTKSINFNEHLQAEYNRFTDTYAQILYKLGQYDSAFYFQHEIYIQDNQLSTVGFERYAIYAERAKGIDYARQVIEQQLLKGESSPLILNQLQSIYKQLKLPEDEFHKLEQKSNSLLRQKTAEAIKLVFGTVKAKNIELKNILGETISLASFKNKVVVLDFWATWCSPCRASFPAMQELLNKYKGDNEVVFLFIDVWENKPLKKMQQAVSILLKENKYTFNVLFDVGDKTVNDYRVKTIPAKFVIDKKGNIAFMGDTPNLAFEIENAKK